MKVPLHSQPSPSFRSSALPSRALIISHQQFSQITRGFKSAVGLGITDGLKILRERKWRAVVETIADCCSDTKITQEYWDFVRNAPADAFFVWLYHGRATSQMIEWARRRRSYSYLGWNWFLAALGGMATGALIVATKDNELVRRQLLFLTALLWGLAALWSAARMRRDADTMEALWAASQIDPAFRECIGRKLPRATRGGNPAE